MEKETKSEMAFANRFISKSAFSDEVGGNRPGLSHELRSNDCSLSKKTAGFTLIEIMIVLAIVGLLFSFVGVNVIKKFRESKIQGAKIQMAAYQQALQAYYLDQNGYPHSSQGLEALIRKPSVGKIPADYPEGGYFGKKELLKDPFGNPYRYECEDHQHFIISSDGPDGEQGTEDDIKSE